ncbi:hypothetical protein B9Z19DRAFT_1067998 [Tuber borchii]|uniref:Endonuclease/exonuclease/phosphatase domain-containing protein n=1 Tax=Tuber borchii TaxID=42251 RepID=A0A2T6ZGT9_TUBBO|nr:hypothetical protein B9Z19DRAFT_1067998 [Tuber borchii]
MWLESRGEVLVMGDFNAWSKRWGGEEEVNTDEGNMVERWIDEWVLELGNEVGRITRVSDKEGGRGRVLDLVVYGGDLSVEVKVEEGLVGMDHRPMEVEMGVIGNSIDKDMMMRKEVDWVKMEAELKIRGGKKCDEEKEEVE